MSESHMIDYGQQSIKNIKTKHAASLLVISRLYYFWAILLRIIILLRITLARSLRRK